MYLERVSTLKSRLTRSRAALLSLLALIIGALVGVGTSTPAQAVMPNFQLPFLCGETWHASTYSGHDAVDWNDYPNQVDNGRSVVASAAGTASLGYQAGGWGYYVLITHADGWQTRYAHLQQDGRVSGSVSQGQRIGYVGSTGDSSQPHLHWEQILNGNRQPTLYANGSAISPGTAYTSADPVYTSANCASAPSWGGVGGATYRGDTLASGDTLYANQYLTSTNVQHALVMQNDGNLVLYHNGTVRWQSGTGGQGGNRVVMQTDGNLVMYRANNTAVWWSGTGGHPGAYANLQSDGNFVVRSSSAAFWWTGTGGYANLSYFGSDDLTSGQQLVQSDYIKSPDGRYALTLQTDGNAVLYGPGYHVLWTSGTGGAGDTLAMQTDGNLVLYALGNWQWQSFSGGNSGAYATLQNDGNFVVYDSSNNPLWWSGTNGQL